MLAHLQAQRSRGFSLIELLISMGISVVAIAAALTLLVAQQRSFQSTSADRVLQETARIALGHITANLRLAGYGVDPALAFDFGPMANVRMDRAPAGVAFSTAAFNCATAVTCRDSVAGPDEIVFLSRDPGFGPHPLLSPGVSGSSLTFFTDAPNMKLSSGQILQAVCYGGNMTWAYLRTNAASSVSGTTATVNVESSASSNFPTQYNFLVDPCYAAYASTTSGTLDISTLSTAAELFKVDRYRYFIQSFDGRPYLMFDQGLTDAAGDPIREVVTPDVEDIQFAYVFPNDPNPATQLVGAAAGTAIATDDTGINLAPASGCPVSTDDPAGPSRLNHHPGNIRAVRVSLVVRSPEPDTGPLGTDRIPAAGNRPEMAGAAGYRRMLIETTVSVRNLDARAPYFPTYVTDTSDDTQKLFNVGGG